MKMHALASVIAVAAMLAAVETLAADPPRVGVAADGTVSAGRYMASGSLEWQRPIVYNGRTTEWESAVFADAGAVANTIGSLETKVGVGAGVRWRSPVGPVQIDLAYGLATHKMRLHLSVGFSF